VRALDGPATGIQSINKSNWSCPAGWCARREEAVSRTAEADRKPGIHEQIKVKKRHWPFGQVEALKDLEADKFYRVLEGQGVVPGGEKIHPVRKATGSMP